MNDIWFTSDTHFSHAKIIEHCNRPFSSVQQMDDVLISNWNRLIGPKDLLYHLGDVFFWRMSFRRIQAIFDQLNGHKHLILGNHDSLNTMKRLNWTWIKPVYELRVGSGQTIWLSHYAHRSWNNSFRGSWHLYGHTHARLHPYGLSFDAGVDSWNFEPINLDTVRRVMTKLKAERKKYPHQPLWSGCDKLKP